MAYAAHATAGGGNGLHGDWPQFLSDEMSARFGGVGLAMEGANGGTQPCRAACAFTKPTNPGYNIGDRKTAIVTNYMAHVEASLANAAPVRGPVRAAQGTIREPITGPAVLALFTLGHHTGTKLLRSHENPWVVGDTIRTVTSALRVGGVLVSGTPGEGFPAIGNGVRDAVSDEQMVIQLGLANDQLGYLIAPYEAYPEPVKRTFFNQRGDEVSPLDNDNYFFNVSHTLGERVTCSMLRGAGEVFGRGSAPRDAYDRCAMFANDAALPEGSDISLSDATSGVPPIR
jgi:hypothetical protein